MTDIFILLLGLLAIIGAVALVAALPVTHIVTSWRGDTLLTLLPYCMMGVATLNIVATDRELTWLASVTISTEARSILVIWLVRFTSMFLVLTSLHLILSNFVGSNTWWHRSPLILAFAFLWITTTLTPALFGAHPELSHEYIYCLLIGLGLISMPMRSGERLIRDARDAIVIFIVLGILMIPIKPAMVLDLGYSGGLIPGLPRFAGFAPHPVAMGLISVVGLLCWISHKYERRWLNVAAAFILLSGLLLAQSKTGWLAALIAMTVLQGMTGLRALFTHPWRGSNRLFWMATLALMIIAVVAVLVLVLFDVIPSTLSAFASSSTGAQLLSLTGRDQIWAVAMEEWRRHPLFGYGPSLFDAPYRMAIRMPFAAHGHNQLVDTLARSGVVGGIGAVVYYATLTFCAMRVAVQSRGLSVALWMLVSMQCITEIPLQLFRYGPENLPHFLLLGVVASHMASAISEVRRAPYKSNLRAPLSGGASWR